MVYSTKLRVCSCLLYYAVVNIDHMPLLAAIISLVTTNNCCNDLYSRSLFNKEIIMIRTSVVAISMLLLLAEVPNLALAKSIKADMSASQLAAYCAQAGSGTTTNTMVNVGGKTVTGSVHCTAKDLTTAAVTSDAGESEKGASEVAENGKED